MKDNVKREGVNLRLRAVEPEDAEFIFSLENDVSQWMYGETVAPLSMESVRAYALTYDANPYRAGQLRLMADAGGVTVGIADLYDISARHGRAMAGVIVAPRFRQRGLGTEMVEELCRYAHDALFLNQIAVEVHADNTASLALFNRCGFEYAGRLRGWSRIMPVDTGIPAYRDVIILQRFLRRE